MTYVQVLQGTRHVQQNAKIQRIQCATSCPVLALNFWFLAAYVHTGPAQLVQIFFCIFGFNLFLVFSFWLWYTEELSSNRKFDGLVWPDLLHQPIFVLVRLLFGWPVNQDTRTVRRGGGNWIVVCRFLLGSFLAQQLDEFITVVDLSNNYVIFQAERFDQFMMNRHLNVVWGGFR